MAQSVSTPSCPLRQAGRHSLSVPLAGLCASLLAVAAQDVEDRLSRSALSSSSHRQGAVGGSGFSRCSGFRSRDPESIDPAALQRIYCTCGPSSKDARRIAPEKHPDPFKEFEDLREAQRCRRRSLPTVDLPRGYSTTSLSVIATSWTSGPCPWQFEPYKAVAALDEISAMTNCGTTRGHYSGSSRMCHRDLRASNVVTLDACIERLCPHPILFQRATLSRLRTERQVGRDDATEHYGSTSATGSCGTVLRPFCRWKPPAVASAEAPTSHGAIDKRPLN